MGANTMRAPTIQNRERNKFFKKKILKPKIIILIHTKIS